MAQVSLRKKLEALEIALLERSSTGKEEETSSTLTNEIKSIQSEFLKFASAFSTNNEKINGLFEENISYIVYTLTLVGTDLNNLFFWC